MRNTAEASGRATEGVFGREPDEAGYTDDKAGALARMVLDHSASWLRPCISRPWISGGSALTPSIGRRTLATALSAQGAGPGTKNTEKHPRGPPERSGGLVLAAAQEAEC